MGIPNKRYKMASQLDPREKAIIVTDYLLPLKRKMIGFGGTQSVSIIRRTASSMEAR